MHVRLVQITISGLSNLCLANKKCVGVELRGLWRDITSMRHSEGTWEFPRTCKQHPMLRIQIIAVSLLHLCIELPAANVDALSHSYFCAIWGAIWEGCDATIDQNRPQTSPN